MSSDRFPSTRPKPLAIRHAGARTTVEDLTRKDVFVRDTHNDRLWEALAQDDVPALLDALRWGADPNAPQVERLADDLSAVDFAKHGGWGALSKTPSTVQTQGVDVFADDNDFDDFLPPSYSPAPPVPLLYCLEHSKQKTFNALLKAGADPHRPDPHLLIHAVLHAAEWAVEALIQAGLDVNANFCSTALRLAISTPNLALVERLLDAGVLPYEVPRYDTAIKNNLLFLACQHATSDTGHAILERMLQTKADWTDASGATVLHHLRTTRSSWVRFFIERGVDPMAFNERGETCLHRWLHWLGRPQPHLSEALETSLLESLSLLLKAAPDAVNIVVEQSGQSPLGLAVALLAPFSVVQALLDAGADPDQAHSFKPGKTVREWIQYLQTNELSEEQDWRSNFFHLLVERDRRTLAQGLASRLAPAVSRRPRL